MIPMGVARLFDRPDVFVVVREAVSILTLPNQDPFFGFFFLMKQKRVLATSPQQKFGRHEGGAPTERGEE